jgi:hypothetical protein
MSTRRFVLVSLLLPAFLAPASAEAGELAAKSEGGITWEAGVDGVVIEWGEDGSFERIYSQYTQPVSIPNSRGVRNAKTIAEEKAKAAIIRFLEQSVSTERLTTEVSTDIESASAQSSNGGDVAFSETARSTAMTSLKEFTSSYASGELRGVIRLEEAYDPSAGEAWVKVGISKKTMRAAKSVQNALGDEGETASTDGSDGDATGHKKSQKAHVKKSQNEDW